MVGRGANVGCVRCQRPAEERPTILRFFTVRRKDGHKMLRCRWATTMKAVIPSSVTLGKTSMSATARREAVVGFTLVLEEQDSQDRRVHKSKETRMRCGGLACRLFLACVFILQTGLTFILWKEWNDHGQRVSRGVGKGKKREAMAKPR